MKIFYKIENNRPILTNRLIDTEVEFILDDDNLLPDKFYFKYIKDSTRYLAERISDNEFKISWENIGERKNHSCKYFFKDVYEYVKEKCVWQIID